MITLINGRVQTANNIPAVPGGSITLILQTDAQVIASPYGQVVAGVPITFKFDTSGNLAGTCQIWSNAELNPSGSTYLVDFYDQNGCRVNASPLVWQFTQANGSTVDIGPMQNVNQGALSNNIAAVLLNPAGTQTIQGFPLIVPVYEAGDGSKTAPSITFASDTSTGFYHRTAGFMSVAAGNIETALFGSDRFHIGTNLRFGNGDTSVNVSDTGISRTAAATIAIGNGSSGDTSGTAVATNFKLSSGAVVNDAGGGNIFITDGITSHFAIVPNTIFRAGSNKVIGWSSTTAASASADTGLSRSATGSLAVGNGAQGDTSGKLTATTYQVGSSGPNLIIDSGRFGNQGVRVQSSGTNNNSALSIMPNGTATESNLRFFNTSDPANTGALEIDLTGTSAVISGLSFGTGTAPTRLTFNGLVLGVGATDTGLSRSAAAVVAVGNGTAGDTSGTVSATRYLASTSNANVTPVTVSGVTAETNLQSLTLAAGDINTVGRWIRVVARGVFSTGATGGTATFKLKFGSTLIKQSISWALGSNITNAGWYWYVDIMTQTSGASGAVEVQGNMTLDGIGASVSQSTATVTGIDLTTSQTVQMTLTPSQSTTSVTQRMMGIAKEN